MKDRLMIHNEVRGLRKYLDEDFVPIDYGGTLHVNDLVAAWEKYYLENQEWKEKVKKLTLRTEVTLRAKKLTLRRILIQATVLEPKERLEIDKLTKEYCYLI